MDKEDTEDEEHTEEDTNHDLKDSHPDLRQDPQCNASEPWKKILNPPEKNEVPPSLPNSFPSVKTIETSSLGLSNWIFKKERYSDVTISYSTLDIICTSSRYE